VAGPAALGAGEAAVGSMTAGGTTSPTSVLVSSESSGEID